jgi:hypothetical protein
VLASPFRVSVTLSWVELGRMLALKEVKRDGKLHPWSGRVESAVILSCPLLRRPVVLASITRLDAKEAERAVIPDAVRCS